MGIQICSNKGAGPIRGKIRKMLINIKKYSSHEPLTRKHRYLKWSILGVRVFKFVQIRFLG